MWISIPEENQSKLLVVVVRKKILKKFFFMKKKITNKHTPADIHAHITNLYSTFSRFFKLSFFFIDFSFLSMSFFLFHIINQTTTTIYFIGNENEPKKNLFVFVFLSTKSVELKISKKKIFNEKKNKQT